MRKTPILAALLGLGLLLGALATPAQAQVIGRRYAPSYYAPSYYAPSYYTPGVVTPYGVSTLSYNLPNVNASSYYYSNPSFYANSYYYNRRPVLRRQVTPYRNGRGYGY